MAKYPKSIGACIDQLYAMREKRQAAQKVVDAAKEEETALNEHIINNFKKDDIEGARGKKAAASISRQTVATVKDWDKLYAYIIKNKAFEMLQRRINDAAYRERLDAKKVVPGVEPYVVTKLNLTKA